MGRRMLNVYLNWILILHTHSDKRYEPSIINYTGKTLNGRTSTRISRTGSWLATTSRPAYKFTRILDIYVHIIQYKDNLSWTHDEQDRLVFIRCSILIFEFHSQFRDRRTNTSARRQPVNPIPSENYTSRWSLVENPQFKGLAKTCRKRNTLSIKFDVLFNMHINRHFKCMYHMYVHQAWSSWNQL